MIVLTVSAFLAVVAVATAIALVDNWIRGREVYNQLLHERALARAGFVPVVDSPEIRQRPRLPRGRAGVSPAFTKRAPRAPRRAIAPLGEARGVA